MIDAHVLLVPGFFGFTQLAGIEYFAQVRRVLSEALKARGLRATITGVQTRPTAALHERARRLATTVAEAAPGPPIHIIGHSTGGLDARLLASPGVDLGPGVDSEALQRRIRSIVTLATPHRGTPLASFFAERAGQQVMKLLSLVAVHVARVGPVPLSLARLLWTFVEDVDAAVPSHRGAAREAYQALLDDFEPEPRQLLSDFFQEVWQDQSLIPQLTPAAVASLTSTWRLPEHVRAASVVTQARRPSLEAVAALGFDPAAQALHQLFRWLRRRSAQWAAPPAAAHSALLADTFGEITVDASDGVVPTLSQPWGEVIAAAWADHLDVVGHFHAPDRAPPHYDWLPSGSRFRYDGFTALWGAVADYLVAAPRPAALPPAPSS